MIHPCNTCIYAYISECTSNETRYNALTDEFMPVEISKEMPCCGCHPGGVVLDNEQPKCLNYKEK